MSNCLQRMSDRRGSEQSTSAAKRKIQPDYRSQGRNKHDKEESVLALPTECEVTRQEYETNNDDRHGERRYKCILCIDINIKIKTLCAWFSANIMYINNTFIQRNRWTRLIWTKMCWSASKWSSSCGSESQQTNQQGYTPRTSRTSTTRTAYSPVDQMTPTGIQWAQGDVRQRRVKFNLQDRDWPAQEAWRKIPSLLRGRLALSIRYIMWYAHTPEVSASAIAMVLMTFGNKECMSVKTLQIRHRFVDKVKESLAKLPAGELHQLLELANALQVNRWGDRDIIHSPQEWQENTYWSPNK